MIKRFTFAAVVALALTGLAASAEAQECGYAQCWGAVGIGPGGAWGFSHGFPNENAAVNYASSECGGGCNNIRSFYNTCGAMAEGNNGAWGFGWANTRWQAEQNALGFCSENGGNCGVTVWSCSP